MFRHGCLAKLIKSNASHGGALFIMGSNSKSASLFLHNFESNLCLCFRAKRAQRAIILNQICSFSQAKPVTKILFYLQEPPFQNQKGSGHPILDPSVVQTITQQVIESLKSAYTIMPNIHKKLSIRRRIKYN